MKCRERLVCMQVVMVLLGNLLLEETCSGNVLLSTELTWDNPEAERCSKRPRGQKILHMRDCSKRYSSPHRWKMEPLK